jgi:hypothetical protein
MENNDPNREMMLSISFRGLFYEEKNIVERTQLFGFFRNQASSTLAVEFRKNNTAEEILSWNGFQPQNSYSQVSVSWS